MMSSEIPRPPSSLCTRSSRASNNSSIFAGSGSKTEDSSTTCCEDDDEDEEEEADDADALLTDVEIDMSLHAALNVEYNTCVSETVENKINPSMATYKKSIIIKIGKCERFIMPSEI